MKHALLLISVAFLTTACVSNRAVQTAQAGDYEMTCDDLKEELVTLGVSFDESEGESGVTGENVALAVVFWPAIIVNEMRSNRNQESISKRTEHLSRIYNGKCLQPQAGK